MPTTKERILVTLSPDISRQLKQISRREDTPKATVAARLIREALELKEELYLAMLAEK